MVRYYLLIVTAGCISPDTAFYKIGFGESKADNRLLPKFEKYARENGFYFHIYDSDTAVFIKKIAESLSLNVTDLKMSVGSARYFMGYISQHKRMPNIVLMPPAAVHIKVETSSKYYFQQAKIVIHRAEAGTRKKPKAIRDAQFGFNRNHKKSPLAGGKDSQ